MRLKESDLMARFEKLTNYRGQAEGANEALTNPLSLVSRPLYLDEKGLSAPELKRWEFPAEDVEAGTATDYARHKASDALVVLGGFQFLASLGVIPTWLVHDATRSEAADLIKERGLEPLLDSLGLAGREHSGDLIGKSSIHEWFQYSPEVEREPSFSRAHRFRSKKSTSSFSIEQRLRHPLRLRKAIELVTIIEAGLRYRYSTGRSINRTSHYLGIPNESVTAEAIWDVVWFEPINYVMSVTPVDQHIPSILENQELQDEFKSVSGEGVGALFWAMKGVPGKFRTIDAACQVCNKAYSDFPPATVTSVAPKDYRGRLKLLQGKAPTEFKKTVEYAPELGPRSLTNT